MMGKCYRRKSEIIGRKCKEWVENAIESKVKYGRKCKEWWENSIESKVK